MSVSNTVQNILNSNKSKKVENIKKLHEKLSSKSIDDFSLEEVVQLRTSYNPFNTSLKGMDGKLLFSIMYPQEEYMKKYHMTALIGFLNYNLEKWKYPKDVPHITTYEFANDPDIYNKMRSKYAADFARLKKIDEVEKDMKKKLIIREFLEDIFLFNPEEHLRGAYVPPKEGEEREPIYTPAAYQSSKRYYKKEKISMINNPRLQNMANMCKSVRDQKYTLPALRYILSDKPDIDKFLKKTNGDPNIDLTLYNMIPPADTFYQYNIYLDQNHEKIRDCVKNLYVEIQDLEFCILPLNVAQTQEEAIKFVEKHKDEAMTDIRIAQFGSWTILPSYKANKDAVKFLDNNALAISRMLEQRVTDAKMSKEMLSHVAKKSKEKNIQEAGPHDPRLNLAREINKEAYKSNNMEEISLKPDSDDECPDDHVDLRIHRVGAGGLKTEYQKVFIPSEK